MFEKRFINWTFQVLNQHLDSPQKIDKKQFNVAIDLSDEEYEELPNSVKDVVNDVFKEEKVLKYLVNTDVLGKYWVFDQFLGRGLLLADHSFCS